MKQLLWIGLGSALGGSLRHVIDLLALQVGFGAFSPSTLVINLTGSLLIGWLAGRWATEGAIAPHPHRFHFWMTGFCGGYTTFSTFTWQIIELVNSGEGQLAGFYAAASFGFGIVAVWLGLSMAVANRKQSES
ncbi:MAG: fluoride efflux transporter FluC [Opitutaceae bacterium]